MSAILFLVAGLSFFADDKSQQSASGQPVAEKKTDTPRDTKKTGTNADEKNPAKKKPEVKEPELRKELLTRVEKEQAARKAWIEWEEKSKVNGVLDQKNLSHEQTQTQEKLISEVKKLDAENTKWLKEVVEKEGWPTISKVGKDGEHAAWLLTQHADRDRDFQRKCLDLMSKLSKNECAKQGFAYLTDRVLLAEKKKQIYGSQITETPDGKLTPLPIEDEKNVDARRKEVGLPTMAKYLAEIEEMRAEMKKSSDKK